MLENSPRLQPQVCVRWGSAAAPAAVRRALAPNPGSGARPVAKDAPPEADDVGVARCARGGRAPRCHRWLKNMCAASSQSSSFADPVSLALAGLIREHRERAGLTLYALAKRVGLTWQGLKNIETHRCNISIPTLGRIGKGLGVKGSVLHWLAERRAARWPAPCGLCNYCCITQGRLMWLNAQCDCTRPKP